MTSIHQRPQANVHERETAVERLQSRWSSSSPVIVDRQPLQPLSRQQLSRRLQQSNSKWTSGSGVICDSPPSKPPSRRGSIVEGLQDSGSRWSSGSQSSFDSASPEVTDQHRMIAQPSNVSTHKHSSTTMKNHGAFKSTIMVCGPGAHLQRAARSA
jgi:hypothetical protein